MFNKIRQFFMPQARSTPVIPVEQLLPNQPKAAPLAHVSADTASHLLAMETIVDHHSKTAGKFIRLRQKAHQAQGTEHSQHADAVLLESLSRMLESMHGRHNRILLVELGANSLAHPLLDLLAAHKAVLLLAEGMIPPSAMARLGKLQAAGLRLALWLNGSWDEALLQLASAFVLTFDAEHSPVDVAEAVETTRKNHPNAALFAVDINWREEYAWCRRIGCHYAAGKLFANPTWPDGPIDPGFVRVLDTLNKLRQDAAPEVIAQTMKHDPLLTFRLLAQANSAALGLARKIETIEQSVVAIGRQRLYRWLVLLLYATAKGGENGAILQEMAQVRAELMIRLGDRYLPNDSEGLYLTGLFSLLEPLMQRPLATLLADVAMPEPVRAALLERSGPYAPFLALAEASENKEKFSTDLLYACGISEVDYNRCLIEALIYTEVSDDHQPA